MEHLNAPALSPPGVEPLYISQAPLISYFTYLHVISGGNQKWKTPDLFIWGVESQSQHNVSCLQFQLVIVRRGVIMYRFYLDHKYDHNEMSWWNTTNVLVKRSSQTL